MYYKLTYTDKLPDNKGGQAWLWYNSYDLDMDKDVIIRMLKKGIKAIHVDIATNNSGSAGTACSLSLGRASGVYSVIASPAGLANDGIARNSGRVTLNANGDMVYTIDATGSATFDIPRFKVTAMEV